MKKVIPFLFIVLLLCSCSKRENAIIIRDDTYKVSITFEDFSYDAQLIIKDENVFLNIENTNASGLTIECNDEYVVFSSENMINKIDKNEVICSNPSLVICEIIKDVKDKTASFADNEYKVNGTIAAGNYEVHFDNDFNLTLISIDSINLKFEFN